MASTTQTINGRTPDAEAAGTKRSAAQASLEIGRDGKSKGFQGCSSIRNYILMSKLGEGTFGEVHKAESRVTGQIVAMKKILMHQEKDGFPVTALREIKLLKMLSHPNVLKLEEMALERTKGEGRKKATVYMVTPYMDHDLSGLLENPSVNFTESHLKCYMVQLLEGVAYLHKSKILHRDMKAANLLINNEGVLQIADFGLARPYDDPPPQPGRGNGEATRGYTTVVVTRWYRPPELLLQLRYYTPAIDMWGAGCVFGEMFKKRPILPGNSDLNQLHLIFDLMGSPTEENMPGWSTLPGCDGVKTFQPRNSSISTAFRDQGSSFISLLSELLNLDWRRRINAIDALKHPYFETHPLPAKPGEIPQFQESHELDRRKFREQRANPPPAPAGGTVGMGPDADFVNGVLPSGHGQHRQGSGQGYYNNQQTYPPRRNGHDNHSQQPAYGSRVPPPPPPAGPPPPARQPGRDRGPNGLPPRPPVDVPRSAPAYSGGRQYDGGRDRYPPDAGRERPSFDSGRPRVRGGAPSQVDTYIPSYQSRDDGRRGRDEGYRSRDEGFRREDRDRRPSDRMDHDERDVRRRRSRSPEQDRERERDRNKDLYRR
ncbi:MAG: hypothetical protein Q9217_002334 [Psora testacea]